MKLAEAMSSMGHEQGRDGGKPAVSSAHEDGGHSELHPHGDGTYHTVTGGQETQHPHIGHALMHLGAHHEPDAKQMHVHSDGMEHTTHHAGEGKVEGPHSHENIEALKDHLGQFFNEEEHEGSGYGGHGRGHESLFED